MGEDILPVVAAGTIPGNGLYRTTNMQLRYHDSSCQATLAGHVQKEGIILRLYLVLHHSYINTYHSYI